MTIADTVDFSGSAETISKVVGQELAGNPQRVWELRDTVYLPLLAQGAHHKALAANQAFLAVAPAAIRLLRDLLEVGILCDDDDAIAKAVAGLVRTAHDDPNVLAWACQEMLKRRAFDMAAEIADAGADSRIGAPRFMVMSMKAYLRSGQRDKACTVALELAKEGPHTLQTASEIAATLITGRHMLIARDVLEAAHAADDPTAARLLAQVLSETGQEKDLDAAVVLLRDQLARSDNDPQFVMRLAEVLQKQGKTAEALATVAGFDPDEGGLQRRLASLLARCGDDARAARIYTGLLEKTPADRPLRRKLVGALTRTGQADDAATHYRAGLALRRDALPERFGDGLQAILEAAPSTNIPESRLAWMARRMKETRFDTAQWQAQAQRVADVDQFFLDWLECNAAQAEQVLPFIEIDPASQALLDEDMAKGTGAFLVTGHIGVLFSGPPAISVAGYKGTWIASMPAVAGQSEQNKLISTETDSPQMIVRRIMQALKANEIVGVAVDGAGAGARQPYDLMGTTVWMSDIVAKLVHRTGTASIFPRLTWQGDHVEVVLVRLPKPEQDEPLEAFVQRWFAAFLSEIASFLEVTPWCMRGSGGLWNNIAD